MAGWQPSNRRKAAQNPVEPTEQPEAKRPTRPSRRRPTSPTQAVVPELLADREPGPANLPPGGNNDRSQDPRIRTRFRPGKRWSQIMAEVKNGDYTWEQFCEGLTNEELARGQLRDEDGGFRGRPPTFVPREFNQYAFRELADRFQRAMRGKLMEATEEYLRLATDPQVDVKTRAKMLEHVMARVMGPVPKEVTVKQAAPWESVVINITSDDGPEEMSDWEQEREARLAQRERGEDPWA